MKKYRYKIVAFLLITGAFVACDNGTTDFEGFNEKTGVKNIVRKEITMTDAFYNTLSSALVDEADKDAKAFINKNKAFSPTVAPAPSLIPKLLAKEYFAADPTSSITVTYKEIMGVDESVAAYTGTSYKIAKEDYQTVWGDNHLYVEAFTPKKLPAEQIPALLATQYPEAKEGDKQNVNYYYSAEEPQESIVANPFFEEDFETLVAYEKLVLEGWINVDLVGEFAFEGRNFNNNNYANVSSYKSGGKNDIWLITPAIELKDEGGLKYSLSFDVNVRNHTQDILSVLISTDFSGEESKIKEATWIDVSDKFDLANKDGNMASAGDMRLDEYNGKNIYIAFHYDGDESPELSGSDKKTTTYQIDNLKVSKLQVGIAVDKTELQYAVFECTGDKAWKLEADKSVVLLQPEDYTAMGEKYPNISKPEVALHKIPLFLKNNYPYEAEETVKKVVYYTWSDKATAEEYILTNGVWERNTWTIDSQSQFILTEKDGWVFDPTILVNFNGNKAAFQMVVDYVADHEAKEYPTVLDDRGNAEFYYGFHAHFGNITYDNGYRVNDPTYPATASIEEKVEFMDKRTIEGFKIYLSLAYPDATPEVSGIEQKAIINGAQIYKDPSSTLNNSFYTYEFQCVGDKQWKALRRISEDDGKIEEYTNE